MADVSAPRPRGDRSAGDRDGAGDDRDDDRGQLFLVGALAMAVLLVTLALLLNTAIYTGNLATRDPGPSTTNVVEYEGAARTMATEDLRTVNAENNSDYANLTNAFDRTVDAWSTASATHANVAGADAHVETVATTRGTHIGQDTDGNLTSDAGAADWTVANESHLRAFRMRVNTSLIGGLFNSSLRLEFTDSTGSTWEVAVDNPAVGDAVTVTSPGGSTETCSASGSTFEVGVTNASVDGARCGALSFVDPDETYNVSIADGDVVNGTYSLVVDRPVSRLETGADGGAGDPYAVPALYSANLRVVYRSSTVAYRTQVRVAPGEADE